MVRLLLRGLNELHELARAGQDPRPHHLALLSNLVGAERAGLACVTDFRPGGRGDFTTQVVWGFGPTRQDVAWLLALETRGVLLDPLARRICAQRPDEVAVFRRSALISDRDWHGDPYVQECVLPADIHDPVYCWVPSSGDNGFGISFHRSRSARAFTDRECLLAGLFMRESLRLLAAAHAQREDGFAQLPRRQRETLQSLREGHSEKAIAAQLGISTATVHDYVKALYRRFGVHSRAELMALLGPCAPAPRPEPAAAAPLSLDRRGAAIVRLTPKGQHPYLPHAMRIAPAP